MTKINKTCKNRQKTVSGMHWYNIFESNLFIFILIEKIQVILDHPSYLTDSVSDNYRGDIFSIGTPFKGFIAVYYITNTLTAT